MNYILLDLSYLIFYRYCALCTWWKMAKPDEDLGIPIENEEFVEKFKKTFIAKIKEIPKKLNINPKDVCFIGGQDCYRGNIWRHKFCEYYKANRVRDESFMGGPFFKKYPESMQWIITNDHDYLQLSRENVFLFNLKYNDLTKNKNCTGDPKKDLFCKIVLGDKSDNILGIFKKCGPKIAQRCYDEPEFLEKMYLQQPEAREKFDKNKKIIDFREIPEDLIVEFMANIDF